MEWIRDASEEKKALRRKKTTEPIRDASEEKKALRRKKTTEPIRDASEEKDRFSELSDDIIIYILSFLYIQGAVQTCVLSKRWIELWKSIPTLILLDSTFDNVRRFLKFVTEVLEININSGELHKFEIRCRNPQITLGGDVLKRISQYVESQKSSLKEIGIFVAADSDLLMHSIAQCQRLTSLRLSLQSKKTTHTSTLFPKSLVLPSLTSLELTQFAFQRGERDMAEPFLLFTKLNSLVLSECKLVGTKILRISSVTLDNLAMRQTCDFGKIELSTPSLRIFDFHYGRVLPEICEAGLSSVKISNILYSAEHPSAMDHGLVLFSWLKGLANVESLTLTSTALQILSLVPDLFEVKLTSLCNLKSLKVFLVSPLYCGPLWKSIKDAMLSKAAAKSHNEADELRKAFEAGSVPRTIPDGIINYLRQNSQFAKVNIKPHWQNDNLKLAREAVEYNLQFDLPSTFAESAAPTSIAESASYLCPAEKDDKSSNEDKVEKHQLNTDSPLPDNEQ